MPPIPIGEDDAQTVKDTRFPEFRKVEGLHQINRGAIDGYRIQSMKEIDEIKERLAKDSCP
jgi:hypothetical protein